MTAFNQYGSKSKADDVSEGKSTEELMAWVDNYCRQHQGENLHRASAAFISMNSGSEPGGDARPVSVGCTVV
jgi:hypothetical protein